MDTSTNQQQQQQRLVITAPASPQYYYYYPYPLPPPPVPPGLTEEEEERQMANSCCTAMWVTLLVLFLLAAIIPVTVAGSRTVKPKTINVNVNWDKNVQPASKVQQYQIVRSNEDELSIPSLSTEPEATSMLMSTHYYSNISGYFEVSLDDSDPKDLLVSGFTLGVFGYGKETLSVDGSDTGASSPRSAKNAAKKGNGTGKNKAKNASDGKNSADRLDGDKKFNAYSGFMASPDEVIATVVGTKGGYTSNGIEVTGSASGSRTYDLASLNWTAVYATVMVALKVDDIPATITVGSGITDALLSLVSSSGSNNVTVQTTAAYAVPDDGSAPPYTAILDREGGKIVLSIDPDWYAGLQSAKRRSDKMAKARTGQTKANADNGAAPSEDESTSDEGGDVLAVSVSVVIPNTDGGDQQDVPVNDDGTIVDGEGHLSSPVLLHDNRLYVVDNIPAKHALFLGSRQYKAGGGWIALLIIMATFVIIESVLAAMITIGWTSVVVPGYEESKLWIEANAAKEYASLMYAPESRMSSITVSDGYDSLSSAVDPSVETPSPINSRLIASPSPSPPPVVAYPPTQARAQSAAGKAAPPGKGKARLNGLGDLLIGKKHVVNTQPGPM